MQITLLQTDITTVAADAIVNAAIYTEPRRSTHHSWAEEAYFDLAQYKWTALSTAKAGQLSLKIV